jgi:hypothetical protein
MMLTNSSMSGYAPRAAAKSAAGISSPEPHRRTSAPSDGVFFVPLWRLCVGGFGLPGSFVSGLLTRVQSPPLISSDAGDSDHKGVTTMAKLSLFPTRDTSARAAAHRAMARAALFSDSSAAVRLKRYNHHITKARTLEAAARGLEVLS